MCACPQTENGYTKIANEIMEALAGIRISGEARQCLDVIIRKTYGFNKKDDYIALSQFALITHLGKTHILRGVRKLEQINIIITQKGNVNGNKYRFNKDFDTWKPLPKKVTLPKKVKAVTQKGNASLPKKVHTKDNTTKDNMTTEVVPTIKIKKPTSPEAELVQYWIDTWSKVFTRRGKPIITNWGRYVKQAKPFISAYGLEKCKIVCDKYFLTMDKFYQANNWALNIFLTDGVFNKLV